MVCKLDALTDAAADLRMRQMRRRRRRGYLGPGAQSPVAAMGPAWSSVSVIVWFLATIVSTEPGPQYSLPNLVWYSVPVSAVPAVPLLQLVTIPEEPQRMETVPVPVVVEVPAAAAAAASAQVTPRKVISTAASAPVADNALGVTLAKQKKPGCPYCDSSVFPYCSDKLLHDACCCLNPYEQGGLPPQCQLADCSFLHANSCKEHRLITRCCCDRLLYIKR